MNLKEKQELTQQLSRHLENLVDMGVSEVTIPPIEAEEASDPGSTVKASDRSSGSTLQDIRDEIGDCTRCKLCEKRTNIVFGVGNPQAELLFIGEGPGRDEDLQGEPFVGRAGQLLTKMIEAMGLKRSDVYIANIVKCRPPDNRYPEPDEVDTCLPFLLKQIDVIQPKVIIGLGNLAVKTLLKTKAGIMSLHGNWQEFHGIPMMPTYHPAFLLRNPNMKRPAWEDLQKVMSKLGLKR